MSRSRTILWRWSSLTPSRFADWPETSIQKPENQGHLLRAPGFLASEFTHPTKRLGVKAPDRDKRSDHAGFSLLEVIAAVVIFAIGMVAALGIFAPVTKSVSTVAEADAAARVADAVRARLAGLPFDQALTLIQEVADVRKKDGEGGYNPNDGTKNPAVLFGKASGDVGIYDAGEGKKAWYDSTVPTPQRMPDADKFFEIDLIRNDTLTPKVNDAKAPMVAFTIRVRWPAFLAASSGAPVQVGANPSGGGTVPYDHSKKQVLFFTGSILR